MATLLTAQEYSAIAANIKFPTKAFINGEFVDAQSGQTFVSHNPATGKVLSHIASCNEKDVDIAVKAARTAFVDGRWSKLSPSQRKGILFKFADLWEQNAHELAVLESLDSGKPVSECELTDVPEAIHTLRWHAELIDKIYDNTAPTGDDSLALVVREPIGVVGLVLPWNFPILMLAWKIAPSLAAGCSLVIKPAFETSLTALKVAEFAQEAGLPAGVFNVLPGSGKYVGEPIGMHHDIDMVSFTGSTEVGRLFLQYAAKYNLKEIVLECGGKNPAVVLNDVEDLEQVATHVVNGAFWNMGENCSSSERLIVHKDIKDALIEKLLLAVQNWQMGDPLDPSNNLGSLVSAKHFAKVQEYISYIQENKFKVVVGGKTQDDIFVEPTIVDGVSPNDRLFKEEIFGPVLAITTFETIDEAIKLANDTTYGLAASIYTSNLKYAIKLARAIRAGLVTVNCFGEGSAATPFGGYKESGFGGRDKSIWAHDQYTQIKTIWLDVA